MGIRRKCGCCKEYFYINNSNTDDAIYYDKQTYHSSCFINICNKRSKMKRRCFAKMDMGSKPFRSDKKRILSTFKFSNY